MDSDLRRSALDPRPREKVILPDHLVYVKLSETIDGELQHTTGLSAWLLLVEALVKPWCAPTLG